MAVLMPVKQRERWKDLVDGLSDYYNSPGRLAVIRQRFESASRRSGMDPATFATELWIRGCAPSCDPVDVDCSRLIRLRYP